MTEPGTIVIREGDRPVPGAHEIVMQTRRIGVCGSDIHVYHGLHPYTGYPVVQGHEVSGVVTDVGSEVEGVAVGDQITFMPQVVCGECYPCRHGMYHICEDLKVMGFQTGGAAQEYFALPAENVLVLPKSMSLDEGAFVEPISVGVHAVRRGGDVAGKKVVVLGAGTIGNLVAQVAKALGAKAVMITDLSDYKLDKARACGIDHTVNTSREDLDQAVITHFGRDRADLMIECVGAQETVTQAVAVARKGTTIVIVGVFAKKPVVDLGLVQDRELSIVGTLMYQKPDYETAIELVQQGKMHLGELITHRFEFEDYLDAYHAIEDSGGKYMKVMIELD